MGKDFPVVYWSFLDLGQKKKKGLYIKALYFYWIRWILPFILSGIGALLFPNSFLFESGILPVQELWYAKVEVLLPSVVVSQKDCV